MITAGCMAVPTYLLNIRFIYYNSCQDIIQSTCPFQSHVGCIVDKIHPNKKLMEEYNPQTQYYQWVTFVFAIQAAVFYLPYKIWYMLEGGLMASFGSDAKTKVMVSKDCDLDDECLVLEAVVDRFVKYFKCVFHRNTWYYAYYICCKKQTFQNIHYSINMNYKVKF